VLVTPTLTFRTIDPLPGGDARLAYSNHCDACRASFGQSARCEPFEVYRRWLSSRVEEFPDGHVFAFLDDRCVGQLELQVPYGLSAGYVNLFCVTPPFRGRGYGRALHDFAERYFRSWEATRIDLDVSPDNREAVGFYRHFGYRFTRINGETSRLWRMEKSL
jgi:ribosomal protein S18 acetylase RimI-like enzyme